MKVSKYLVIISLLLMGVSGNTSAQKTETLALDRLLIQLQNRFDVVFTYADANIEGISVRITPQKQELEAYLQEIEDQTGLSFERVDRRFIAIRKPPSDIKISGTIIDKTTDEKLAGAVVYSVKNHTISNNEGYFSITIKPTTDSILTIRHLGFKTRQIDLRSLNPGYSIIEMIPQIQKLEEVRMNYIIRGIDKLIDGTLQLNTHNIGLLPGHTKPDILHIIQVLPGIQSINETVSDINTRGGTNDQTLVLWDGVKMYQSGHFFGLISAFNSHLVHRTRIIKNGSSVAYDEGVSGIVDLQLQEHQVGYFYINTGVDMLSADVIAKIPINKRLSLIMSARHSINDIIKTPAYNSYYRRAFEHTEVMLTRPGTDTTVNTSQAFSFYDLSTKILYDVSERDKIRFSFLNNQNTIEYEENALIRDSLFTRLSRLRQSNSLSNISYTRSWQEGHTTQLSAFLSSYILKGNNYSLLENRDHLQENEVLDWGLKLESNKKINQYIHLLGGYQFNEVGIRNLDNIRKPNYFRNEKDVLRIHSLYTEAEFIELLKRVYLRLGLRANYFPEFESVSLEPRASLNYSLSENISLNLQAESKSQHTTQLIDYQTDFLGIEKRRWVLSNNQSIPLIKSQQVSAGIQYRPERFLISAEGYLKQVEGLITPSQGFQNQFEYVYSSGGYEVYGLEFLVNKSFKNSNFWLTYTLAENTYQFPGLSPSTFPNNLDVRHSLALGGSYKVGNFELSTGFNYRSGRPYTQPASYELSTMDEILYEEPNSSRLKDYLRVDFSARYLLELKSLQTEIGFSIWNLLNRDNVYNIYYQLNDSREIEQISRKTLGITPNISLRLRF